MKKRILFVDDEPAMLEIFALMFRPMENEWELEFAKSGPEALAVMEKAPFEVVVTDMQMADMTGAQLLNEVMQRYPRTARIILSGYAEHENVAKCVGAAHQYLMKPCDVKTLRSTLTRVCALDVFLKNEHLKGLCSQMGVLPSLPSLYFKVLKELQSSYATSESIGELVSMDPAMTAKLLQLVNSAFFGIAREISNPVDAVQLLGVNTVRSLALTIHAFSCFNGSRLSELSFEKLWRHSLATGNFSRKITQKHASDLAMADEAFISGLLHDLGKLMLAANMPDQYTEALTLARDKGLADCDAEMAVFQANHADVGAYLLGLWGLPVPVVEAVALHHTPSKNVQLRFCPLTAVHVVNVLDHHVCEEAQKGVKPSFDFSYLDRLGLRDAIPSWQESYAEFQASVSLN